MDRAVANVSCRCLWAVTARWASDPVVSKCTPERTKYETGNATTVDAGGCFRRRVGSGTGLSDHGGSTGKRAIPVCSGVPNALGQDRDAGYREAVAESLFPARF